MNKTFTLLLAGAALAITATTALGQAPATDPDTGLPVMQPFRFPASPAVPAFWARRVTGYLTTTDGVRLRYAVLLPRASGRVPVIVNVHGYDAGSIGGLAYRQRRTAQNLELDRRLLEAGYAVMGVNTAGTGCSEGTLEYLRPQLGRHGAEAVEFAAAQSWSDGRVGMAGSSYGGASQLATALNRPPHLRAIAPGMVLTDYREALAPGGVPQPGFITPFRLVFRAYWEDPVTATAKEEGDDACLRQVERNLAAEEATQSIMQLVTSHPLRDATMGSHDFGRDLHRIDVPVLSMEAFQDQAVTARGGHYQAVLDPMKVWLVQTNGSHDLYTVGAFQDTVVRFLDRFVRDQPNGFERDTPRTRVWMELADPVDGGAARRAEARAGWMVDRGTITPDDVEVRTLHLGAGGTLGDSGAPGAADGFDAPGTGVAVNDLGGNAFWGPLPADWRETQLAYTSAPLAEDTMLYGPASADLWVAAMAGDADLQVTVTEVRPDGQEMYVQRGWLRLSNRTLDTTRSTPLRPVALEDPERLRVVLPGRPVLARVEVNKMGHFVRKGSRLRLWIDTPAQTGGMVFDTFSLRQRVHVLHTAKFDSLLRFGVLRGVRGPAALPACGRVLMQPCRPDPLAAGR